MEETDIFSLRVTNTLLGTESKNDRNAQDSLDKLSRLLWGAGGKALVGGEGEGVPPTGLLNSDSLPAQDP